MVAKILDGIATAKIIKQELALRVQNLKDRGVIPGLGTILVGEDPGSKWYVAGKHKDCAEIGISSIRKDLDANTTEEELIRVIKELNEDPSCTAYIVQLPLPNHIDTDKILSLIDPKKDADGLHPYNLGSLVLNSAKELKTTVPCTPRAVIELVTRYGISWQSKHVVVIGRGITVGRPISSLLTRKDCNATVTLCHTATANLAEHTKQADIVIAAAGSPNLLTADMVKPDAVVLDVGVSRVERNGKQVIVGDVDPEVAHVAAWVSPNPGGVGPMTRALLLANVVETAERL